MHLKIWIPDSYGHFEYCVVFFSLVNAPAAFQTYINLTLRKNIDDFVIAYLDNIIIFLKYKKDHNHHVRLMLQKFCEFNLYVKLPKCIFDVVEIEFLGFKVSPNILTMDPKRVDTIAKWPKLQSLKDI